jgi:UDP-2-acetamido-2,6-beta-L-arabino-hexul-4-ose reductase
MEKLIGIILLVIIGYFSFKRYLNKKYKGYLKFYDGIQENTIKEANKILNNYLLEFSKRTHNPVYIYRLPGLFGKWCRPNYNSVVATFCFNIARNKKINISDKNKVIKLFYIDDLVKDFLNKIKLKKWSTFVKIKNIYSITLLELANLIRSFNIKDNT